MFYLNWERQIEELPDETVVRFMKNLIKYHSGREVELPSIVDKVLWFGVLPGLDVNIDKWNDRAERSRENGKLGGRPPKIEHTLKTKQVTLEPKKPEQTRQVNLEPKKPVNSEKEIDNSKMTKDNRKDLMVKSEKMNDNVTVEISSVNSPSMTLKEYREVFNELFEDYPNWESDLLKLGVNQFLFKNKDYQINNKEYKCLFEEFLSL